MYFLLLFIKLPYVTKDYSWSSFNRCLMASGSQFSSLFTLTSYCQHSNPFMFPQIPLVRPGHKRWWGKFFSVPLSDATRLASKSQPFQKLCIGTSSYSLSSFSVTLHVLHLSFPAKQDYLLFLNHIYLFLNCKPLSLLSLEHLPSIKFDSCRTTNLQALFKAHVRMLTWIPCKHPLLLLPESLCCSPNGLFVFP